MSSIVNLKKQYTLAMGGNKMFDFLNPDNVTQKPLPAPQGDEYAEEAWGIETYGEPIKK